MQRMTLSLSLSSLECGDSHAAFCQGDGAEEQDFGKYRSI